MKWLFFILILANIGLFVWIYPQYVGHESTPTPAVDGERLLLLSEVERETKDNPQALASAGAPDDRADAKPDTVTSDTEQQDSIEGISAQTPQLASVVEPPILTFPKKTQQDTPLDRAEPNPADRPPESQTIEASTPETVKTPSVLCARIGPLGKRAQADELSLRLRAMGLEPELNSEVTNEQEGYWVLVPPQISRAQAVNTVERLREAGVTDLWRFTSGKLAHAISLGLFKHKSRAEIRRKAIAEKGFDVEVRPRYRQKTHYWLSYGYTDGSPITDGRWSELTTIFPEIERLSIDCQEIASPLIKP